jgi:glucokinase-like ROK family protein
LTSFFNYFPTINVKNLNKHTALDLVRFTPGGISRAGLAQQLLLSRAAVTAIVNDLLQSGAIREAESRTANGGRPPIILEINPGGGHVAGVDMGAAHLGIIVANFTAQVLAEADVPFDIAQGPQACLAQADELLRTLLKKAGIPLERLLAIGVGVPGPVQSEAGTVIAPPIMPGWDRYPIRERLEEIWACPVSLNNDAELGALGEWAYGAGRAARNLAYIKVGTGVGAGLLLDGQIYRGSTGSAGEIGHLTIDENGLLCNCGNRGCLETLTGGQAIARQAQEAVRSGRRTQMAEVQPVESLSAMHVADAAQRGDHLAQQILSKAGGHLGVALAGLVNLFNPNMVVVGGGVAQIGDLFLEPVRQAVHKRSLPAAAQAVRISTALLGRRSSSMGAVVQALTIALHQFAEGKEVNAG